MKYAFSELAKIESKIEKSKHIAVLLDFDGTISPIVKKPQNAYITKNTRHLIKKINRKFPVIIVTGRPMNVIKEKVGISCLIYTASHGLEWNFAGPLKIKKIPKNILEQLDKFRKNIENVTKEYPSLITEKKPFAITFHYHSMNIKHKKDFEKWLDKFLKPIYKNSLVKIFHDKETVEITPNLNWTKGDISKLALKHLYTKNKSKFMPIYIGDSTTDEDAFHALSNGITIRVGKSKKSAAKWYLRNQKEVENFLKWLLNLKKI